MILALFFTMSLVEDGIQMKSSTPSMAAFQIEFSEFKRNEQFPIARFVLSESKPTYEYDAIEIDSSISAGDQAETEPVRIGEPLITNGAKLYPIMITPSFTRDNVTHYVKSADIRLNFSPPTRTLNIGPTMGNVFERLVLNFEYTGDQRPQGYLIITPAAFVEELQPLVRWKEKKGWRVEIRTTSQT
jgi:hypothetical protein